MKIDKSEPLLGFAQGAEMIVQKSVPLLSLWRAPLSLPEFKILDAYLARIDSHHPDQRWVRFSKGELESILNVKKINIYDLNARIQHLCIMVQIENTTLKNEGFDAIALFERAVCERDSDGTWIVDLCCTQSAMQYIFNVETLGYLRYKLRSIVQLTSRYSYLLFLYLERNRFRGCWEVPVDDLRDYLGCTESTYAQYKFFNQLVLKRAQLELENKTDCHFSYEPIRQGRRITSLRFRLVPILPPPSPSIISSSATVSSSSSPDRTKIYALQKACQLPNGTPEFSVSEIDQIACILPHIPKNKFPQSVLKFNPLLAWQEYLAERYAALNRLAEKNLIRHRFNYLLKMIKEDAGLK